MQWNVQLLHSGQVLANQIIQFPAPCLETLNITTTVDFSGDCSPGCLDWLQGLTTATSQNFASALQPSNYPSQFAVGVQQENDNYSPGISVLRNDFDWNKIIEVNSQKETIVNPEQGKQDKPTEVPKTKGTTKIFNVPNIAQTSEETLIPSEDIAEKSETKESRPFPYLRVAQIEEKSKDSSQRISVKDRVSCFNKVDATTVPSRNLYLKGKSPTDAAVTWSQGVVVKSTSSSPKVNQKSPFSPEAKETITPIKSANSETEEDTFVPDSNELREAKSNLRAQMEIINTQKKEATSITSNSRSCIYTFTPDCKEKVKGQIPSKSKDAIFSSSPYTVKSTPYSTDSQNALELGEANANVNEDIPVQQPEAIVVPSTFEARETLLKSVVPSRTIAMANSKESSSESAHSFQKDTTEMNSSFLINPNFELDFEWAKKSNNAEPVINEPGKTAVETGKQLSSELKELSIGNVSNVISKAIVVPVTVNCSDSDILKKSGVPCLKKTIDEPIFDESEIEQFHQVIHQERNKEEIYQQKSVNGFVDYFNKINGKLNQEGPSFEAEVPKAKGTTKIFTIPNSFNTGQSPKFDYAQQLDTSVQENQHFQQKGNNFIPGQTDKASGNVISSSACIPKTNDEDQISALTCSDEAVKHYKVPEGKELFQKETDEPSQVINTQKGEATINPCIPKSSNCTTTLDCKEKKKGQIHLKAKAGAKSATFSTEIENTLELGEANDNAANNTIKAEPVINEPGKETVETGKQLSSELREVPIRNVSDVIYKEIVVPGSINCSDATALKKSDSSLNVANGSELVQCPPVIHQEGNKEEIYQQKSVKVLIDYFNKLNGTNFASKNYYFKGKKPTDAPVKGKDWGQGGIEKNGAEWPAVDIVKEKSKSFEAPSYTVKAAPYSTDCQNALGQGEAVSTLDCKDKKKDQLPLKAGEGAIFSPSPYTVKPVPYGADSQFKLEFGEAVEDVSEVNSAKQPEAKAAPSTRIEMANFKESSLETAQSSPKDSVTETESSSSFLKNPNFDINFKSAFPEISNSASALENSSEEPNSEGLEFVQSPSVIHREENKEDIYQRKSVKELIDYFNKFEGTIPPPNNYYFKGKKSSDAPVKGKDWSQGGIEKNGAEWPAVEIAKEKSKSFEAPSYTVKSAPYSTDCQNALELGEAVSTLDCKDKKQDQIPLKAEGVFLSHSPAVVKSALYSTDITNAIEFGEVEDNVNEVNSAKQPEAIVAPFTANSREEILKSVEHSVKAADSKAPSPYTVKSTPYNNESQNTLEKGAANANMSEAETIVAPSTVNSREANLKSVVPRTTIEMANSRESSSETAQSSQKDTTEMNLSFLINPNFEFDFDSANNTTKAEHVINEHGKEAVETGKQFSSEFQELPISNVSDVISKAIEASATINCSDKVDVSSLNKINKEPISNGSVLVQSPAVIHHEENKEEIYQQKSVKVLIDYFNKLNGTISAPKNYYFKGKKPTDAPVKGKDWGQGGVEKNGAEWPAVDIVKEKSKSFEAPSNTVKSAPYSTDCQNALGQGEAVSTLDCKDKKKYQIPLKDGEGAIFSPSPYTVKPVPYGANSQFNLEFGEAVEDVSEVNPVQQPEAKAAPSTRIEKANFKESSSETAQSSPKDSVTETESSSSFLKNPNFDIDFKSAFDEISNSASALENSSEEPNSEGLEFVQSTSVIHREENKEDIYQRKSVKELIDYFNKFEGTIPPPNNYYIKGKKPSDAPVKGKDWGQRGVEKNGAEWPATGIVQERSNSFEAFSNGGNSKTNDKDASPKLSFSPVAKKIIEASLLTIQPVPANSGNKDQDSEVAVAPNEELKQGITAEKDVKVNDNELPPPGIVKERKRLLEDRLFPKQD